MKKVKLIALCAALVAGLAIFQFLKELGKPQEIPHTNVVVAAVDIAENTVITADMLTMSPVVTEAVLPTCILDPSLAVGMVMKSDVYAGEQIVSNRLIKVGEFEDSSTSLAYVVEPGMRAISISVNSLTSVSNMIRPGNRVDVILNYEYLRQKAGAAIGLMEKVTETKYLLEDVLVLAVGQNMSKAGSSEYSLVTLQLSPDDALLLTYGETNHNLRLVLRNTLDDEPNNSDAIEIDNIVEANI